MPLFLILIISIVSAVAAVIVGITVNRQLKGRVDAALDEHPILAGVAPQSNDSSQRTARNRRYFFRFVTAIALFLAFLFIVKSAYLLASERENNSNSEEKQESSGSNELGNQQPEDEPQQVDPDQEPQEIEIPFASVGFPEASCRDALDGTASGGTELPLSLAAAVNELGRQLAMCAADTEAMKVRVRGFASTSECRSQANSELANLMIANARARAVFSELQSGVSGWDEGGASRIQPELVTWQTYENMRERRWLDVVSGEYLIELGDSNRRAEIRLVNPSSECLTHFLFE